MQWEANKFFRSTKTEAFPETLGKNHMKGTVYRLAKLSYFYVQNNVRFTKTNFMKTSIKGLIIGCVIAVLLRIAS